MEVIPGGNIRHPFGLSLSKPTSSVLCDRMGFWTYMLHCADRKFYVGHTEDLDIRIAQHEQGESRVLPRFACPLS